MVFNQFFRNMRKFNYSFIIFLLFTTIAISQKKKISLEEIWGGSFRTEGLDVLRSMKNGTQYTAVSYTHLTLPTILLV